MIQRNPLDATTKTWRKPPQPRTFLIEFNHKKVNPFRSGRYMAEVDAQRHETQMREGTLYSNGVVTLDSGVCYDSLAEMKETLEHFGDVQEPVFFDEMEQAE
jgi:hypothetical protein